MQTNSENQVPEIVNNVEDNVDLTSFLIDSTRLQNNVRKTYLRYLEMILKHNLQKYGFTDIDFEMTHKVAISLELAAARASMVVALYQRQMKAIISDIKRNTQEGRLHLFCTLTSPPSQEKATLSLDEIIPNTLTSEEFEHPMSNNVHLPERLPEQNQEILNDDFDHEEEIALMNKDEFIDYINLKQVPTLEPMDVLNDIEKNAWIDSTNSNETRVFAEKFNSEINPLTIGKSAERNSWNDSTNPNETRIFSQKFDLQINPFTIKKSTWNDSTNANETRVFAEKFNSEINPLTIGKSTERNSWNDSTNAIETRIFTEKPDSQINPLIKKRYIEKDSWNDSTNANERRIFTQKFDSQINPLIIHRSTWNDSTNANDTRVFAEKFNSEINPLTIGKSAERNSWNDSINAIETRIFTEKPDSQINPLIKEKFQNFVEPTSFVESENLEESHINESTNVLSLDQRLENIYAGEIPVLAAIIRASEENQEEQSTIPEPEIKTPLPITDNSITTNMPIKYEKQYLKKTTKILTKSTHIKKKIKVKVKKDFILNTKDTNKNEITFEKKPNVHFEKIEFPPKQITSTRRSTEESLDELLERQLEQVHSGIDPFEEEQNEEEIEHEQAEIKRKRFEDKDLLNHWKHSRRFYSRRQAYRMSIKSIRQNERIRVLYYQLLGERFDEDTRKLTESEQSRILFRKKFAPIIVRSLMGYLKRGYMKSRMAFKTMAKRVAAAADDLCLNENEIIDYIHNLFPDNMRFETEKEVWDYSPRVHFTSEELNNSKVKVKIEKDLINIKQEKFD